MTYKGKVSRNFLFCRRPTVVMAPKAAKAPVTCNWVPSIITKSKLSEFVKSGHLPKKEVMSYRAPDLSEERPEPKEKGR